MRVLIARNDEFKRFIDKYPYIAMYLGSFIFEGPLFKLKMDSDGTLDIKLTIDDMVCNVDSEEAQKAVTEFMNTFPDGVKFYILKVINL